MRLGKKKEKERDSDGRSQTVEGVSRLICSVKTSHSAPMRGKIVIILQISFFPFYLYMKLLYYYFSVNR